MGIAPVQEVSVAEVATAAPKHEKTSVQPQAEQRKDTAIISEKGKDMAAKLSGKTFAEEAKESPAVEAREEQAKLRP